MIKNIASIVIIGVLIWGIFSFLWILEHTHPLVFGLYAAGLVVLYITLAWINFNRLGGL